MVHTTEKGHKICFTSLEIPVGYEDVDIVVGGFHQDQKFDFIVHIGLGQDGMVKFEQKAHSGGYKGKDVHGETGPLGGDEVFVTIWDVHRLVDQIRKMGYEVRLHSTMWLTVARFCFF